MPKDKSPKPKAKLIPPPKHERPKWMRDAARKLDELHKARIKAKQQSDAARNKDIVDELTTQGISGPVEEGFRQQALDELTPEEIKEKINRLREGPLYK